MKCSRAEVRGKARAISELRFEEQTLTSFAGLVIFQKFFLQFGLKGRLRRCFSHLKVSPIYAHFAELKTDCQIGYIPVTTRVGNQLYLLCALLAHNLNRELQMQVQPITRRTTEKCAELWKFQELNTLRRNLLQRAGRIIRPNGKVTLSMSDNPAVKTELLHYLIALDQCCLGELSPRFMQHSSLYQKN